MKDPIAPIRGRLLGVRDAATYLGVTESKVRRVLRRGELVVVRTTKGRLEGIYERDLDAWIEQHRRVPMPAVRPAQVAVDERVRALMPPVRKFA